MLWEVIQLVSVRNFHEYVVNYYSVIYRVIPEEGSILWEVIR